MSKKVIKLINLIVAVLIATVMVGYAFAWFIDMREEPQQINGSSGTPYFESGDGSAADPYLISNRYHMYNLAWLQNTGRLTEKYYFKVKNDLDLTDIWLPPIGTDKYPFKGDFNGDGKNIIDLKVTTDEDKLRGYGLPSNKDRFSNAVGMFGMTANSSEIHNFILDNPTVEVASVQKTSYANLDNADTQVAGLAVGLVCGKAYSIGVRATEIPDGGTRLWVDRAGYSTFNSIIGGLGTNVSSSVTGGGAGDGTGGSGADFGASFAVDILSARLEAIENNTTSWKLPAVSSGLPEKGEKIAFTVVPTDSTTTPPTFSYPNADSEETVAANNVGYFTGNQNKIDNKNITFRERLVKGTNGWTFPDGSVPDNDKNKVFPNWFYKIGATGADGKFVYAENNYTTTHTCYEEMTETEYNSLPASIKQLLVVDENNDALTLSADNKQSKGYTTIRLGAQYWGAATGDIATECSPSDGNVKWAYHGQISWDGTTYGEGYRYSDGKAVNAEGKYLNRYGQVVTSQSSAAEFNGMYNGVPLPSNAIWFKPVRAGTIRIVLYSEEPGDAFALVKCTRKYASASDPFALTAARGIDTGDGWGEGKGTGWGQPYLDFEYVFMHQLPPRTMFYYEYEVDESSLVNGTFPEYMLCKGNTSGGGAYFVYLDIGASASEEEADHPMLDDTKNVSAVDFVYSDVSIKQTKESGDTIDIGNFIISTGEAYEATATSIVFEKLETTLKIVYIRKAVTSDVADDARISAAVTGITGENPVTATVTRYATITP